MVDERFDKDSPMQGSNVPSILDDPNKQPDKPKRRQPKIRPKPEPKEGKETILTYSIKTSKKGYRVKQYRWVHIKPENKNKKYGRLPRKTESGEPIYVSKIKVYNPETGKTQPKKVTQKDKYIKIGRSWQPYDPKKMIDIPVMTKRGVELRRESMEAFKYGYKKKGNTYERKPGNISKPSYDSYERDDRPKAGQYLKATVTFSIKKSDGKIEEVKTYGFSKTQPIRQPYTYEQMELQAINFAISDLIKLTGIDSESARGFITDSSFEVETLL